MGLTTSNEKVYVGADGDNRGESAEISTLQESLGAFKAKMGSRAVDKAVQKMLPPRYIRGAIVTSTDVELGKEAWLLIVTDSSPEYINRYREKSTDFKYSSCISKWSRTNEFVRVCSGQ
jgi:hypothetical protein